jgi:hypothetical protein
MARRFPTAYATAFRARADPRDLLLESPRFHLRLFLRYDSVMPLPEAIAVRYTEEEAGYVSFRPVVRQSFRPDELLDMVLSVTGKDPARIRQIFRSGTVVFHFYRYWWTGFDVDETELAALLARFPDPDPSRQFRSADCTTVAIESGATPPRPAVEVHREAISRPGLFRRRTLWDALLAELASTPLAYQDYSFAHHADLYRLDLTAESRARLAAAAASLAPRIMRKDLQAIGQASRVVFVCPRPAA